MNANCMELGYTSNLMCSSCKELKDFNLKDLEEECSQCCQPDGVTTDEKVKRISHIEYSGREVDKLRSDFGVKV